MAKHTCTCTRRDSHSEEGTEVFATERWKFTPSARLQLWSILELHGRNARASFTLSAHRPFSNPLAQRLDNLLVSLSRFLGDNGLQASRNNLESVELSHGNFVRRVFRISKAAHD